MLSQTARLALFAGVDVVFKTLIAQAFLQALGAHAEARRAELVELLVPVLAAAWCVQVTLYWFAVRPIDRFVKASAIGHVDDEVLRRAAEATVPLPLRLALMWGIAWAASFAVVVALDGHPFDAIVLLFLIAAAIGPFCVAHAVATWFTTQVRRSLDLRATQRGLTPKLPTVTVRSRLIMYAFGIALTPSAYMGSLALSARTYGTEADSLAIALVSGFVVVVVFSIGCGYLVGNTLTQPVLDLAQAVRAIAHRGSAQTIGRIARHEGDEIGVLVERTNEMIERLERAEVEGETARANLEKLNRTLEERVDDRTRQLLEASVSLEHEAGKRAKIESELAIAHQIQTSILPKQWHIDGLELAAAMVTATRVGGDYYDILPRAGGGYLAIGDVSGHGVAAGMIMLMLQGVTASVVASHPDASTSELVLAINRVLTENIRKRMQVGDFVTFTLFRYEFSGRLRYAGAHEDIVVWRAATGRCELVATVGTWLGLRTDIANVTTERELVLAPGDLLVLYTDGVTEARDERRVQFGPERLCATIEANARRPVEHVVEAVLDAVKAWSSGQDDDISIVVARQR